MVVISNEELRYKDGIWNLGLSDSKPQPLY